MKSFLSVLLAFFIIFSLAACGSSDGDASSSSGETGTPLKEDAESAVSASWETNASSGYIEDVKSGIIGEWYFQGRNQKGQVLFHKLTYEPYLAFRENGAFELFETNSTYYDDATYKIDNNNILYIKGDSYSFDPSGDNGHSYYLTYEDGPTLYWLGRKLKKSIEKGPLFEKILGEWTAEGSNADYTYFCFNEDTTVTWIEDNQEMHGKFCICEDEGILCLKKEDEADDLDSADPVVFTWNLYSNFEKETYGINYEESFPTWGFADFDDTYNLKIQGVLYTKSTS